MEFVVERRSLLAGLRLAQHALDRKTKIPILSCVLVEAHGEGVELTVTDLDVGLRSRLLAKVVTAGVVAVPLKPLLDYVQLAGPTIAVRLRDDGCVQVSFEGGHITIGGRPREDFPVFAVLDPRVEIPAPLLGGAITKTLFAVTGDSSRYTRYTLDGALVILKPDSLTMVATDGHRLAIVDAACQTGSDARVLVPKKALLETQRILARADGNVRVGWDENWLSFRYGHRTLVTRLLEERFPDYEHTIPHANDRILTADRDALLGVVRRLAVTTREVQLHLEAGILKAKDGDGDETMTVDYSAEPMQIRFSVWYLLDFLKAVGPGPVRIALKGPLDAALLTSLAEPGYRYVLMPCRL